MNITFDIEYDERDRRYEIMKKHLLIDGKIVFTKSSTVDTDWEMCREKEPSDKEMIDEYQGTIK